MPILEYRCSNCEKNAELIVLAGSFRPSPRTRVMAVPVQGTSSRCAATAPAPCRGCVVLRPAASGRTDESDRARHGVKAAGKKTKKAAVTLALTEFIARREQIRLRRLFGKLRWNPDFDYKAERTRS